MTAPHPHLLTCQMTGPRQRFPERFLGIRVLGDVLLTENVAVTVCGAPILLPESLSIRL